MFSFRLQTDSVLQVPIYNYQENFLFCVNGKQFQTTKIVADLLSPKIAKIHQIDPTFSEFTVNTQTDGDFQHILSLLTFKTQSFNNSEIPFISEIIGKLETERIDINIPSIEINLDNVIKLISEHEASKFFYSKQLSNEIDFLSENFNEIVKNQSNELFKLSKYILKLIISNRKLSLDSEDQLLHFINVLYSKSSEFAELFEYVYFQNVTSEAMKEFVSNFNIEHITQNLWESLSKRLTEKVTKINNEQQKERYKMKEETKICEQIYKEIPFSNNNLKGIFSYFMTQSNIKDEVNMSLSSHDHGSKDDVLNIDCTSNYLCTKNEPNSWICFEFKKHKIIPSNYTIRTTGGGPNLKSWVIEGSNDNQNWDKIDEQNNCNFLNGSRFVHTFPINVKLEEGIKYLRIRQTALSSDNNHYIDISSAEFYGKLI